MSSIHIDVFRFAFIFSIPQRGRANVKNVYAIFLQRFAESLGNKKQVLHYLFTLKNILYYKSTFVVSRSGVYGNRVVKVKLPMRSLPSPAIIYDG